MRAPPRSQQGVALIVALLIVALATTAAVSMASRQHLDIRRTGNTLNAGQAYLYVLGMEGWAGQILRRDLEDNKVDHLGEEWATVLPPIPIDGGQLAGAITDMQGRFNINRLVAPKDADTEGKTDDPKVEPAKLAQERFQRLLSTLGLDPALTWNVVDWLDENENVDHPPHGGEDGLYLNLELPYRAANRPMMHPSELRLVAGFTPEVYARVAPYITALPADAGLNVNTISPDQPELLVAMAEGITIQDAKMLLDGRGEEGFGSVEEFLRDDALAGREVNPEGLATATRYFMVSSSVLLGSGSLAMNSILVRDGNSGATHVWFRAQEAF